MRRPASWVCVSITLLVASLVLDTAPEAGANRPDRAGLTATAPVAAQPRISDWRQRWRPDRTTRTRLLSGRVLGLRSRSPQQGRVRVTSREVVLHRGDRVTAKVRLQAGRRIRSARLLVLSADRPTHVLARTTVKVRASKWTRISMSYVTTRRVQPVLVRLAAGDRKHRAPVRIAAAKVRTVPARPQPAMPQLTATQPTSDPAKTPCQELDYSASAQGVLDWSDEFDGDSLDESRWRARHQESLSYDQARILRDNVSVAHGRLAITARRHDVAGRHFTTGYVDTIGRYSRQWGRWELRAKLPTAVGTSRGIWPAFWLRADHAPGEIDVMEAWGQPTARPGYRSGSYQWTVHQDTHADGDTARRSGWGTAAGQPPVADAFHLYAVDWSPDCMVFSFDRRVVGVVKRSANPWLTSAFPGPVNVRLNLQIGQRYWGFADPSQPDLTDLPASLEVDYLRVYRPNWAD